MVEIHACLHANNRLLELAVLILENFDSAMVAVSGFCIQYRQFVSNSSDLRQSYASYSWSCNSGPLFMPVVGKPVLSLTEADIDDTAVHAFQAE